VNLSKGTGTIQRRLLSWLWIYFLQFTGLLDRATRKIAESSGIVVLTFHRVLPRPEFEMTHSPPGMVVRQETFDALLSYLRANCEIVALSGDAPDWKSSSKRPRVAVTFDDGWKDTSEIASRITSKYGIPITVFVCPGLAGQEAPFWPEKVSQAWFSAASSSTESEVFSAVCGEMLEGNRFRPSPGQSPEALLRALKELPSQARCILVKRLTAISEKRECVTVPPSSLERTMTWQDASALSVNGNSIGSHTFSHEILTGLALNEAREEINKSKSAIEAELGGECKMFAYPNGSWSAEVRNLVAQVRYTQAFINHPGIWKLETDPWVIPRVNVWEGSLTSSNGCFSAPVFQYAVFWRAYRESLRRNSG
jgi:peptidoglycan/xylan/chitin deacetylase (PgdA/CDA1 family)